MKYLFHFWEIEIVNKEAFALTSLQFQVLHSISLVLDKLRKIKVIVEDELSHMVEARSKRPEEENLVCFFVVTFLCEAISLPASPKMHILWAKAPPDPRWKRIPDLVWTVQIPH